jgi:hypothetical protein
MPISMNIEKYHLVIEIIIKPHSNSTYKNTTQNNYCIIKLMKMKNILKYCNYLMKNKGQFLTKSCIKKGFILMN